MLLKLWTEGPSRLQKGLEARQREALDLERRARLAATAKERIEIERRLEAIRKEITTDPSEVDHCLFFGC